jgi:hypothetical protein
MGPFRVLADLLQGFCCFLWCDRCIAACKDLGLVLYGIAILLNVALNVEGYQPTHMFTIDRGA